MLSVKKAVENFFRGWNPFEYALLFAGLTVPLGLGILFESDVLVIIGGTLSALVSLLLAKGKIEGYFLALVSASLYGIIAWKMDLYGEVAIQFIVMYPIAFFGIVSWARHRRKDRIDGQVVVVGHVGRGELLSVILSQIILAPGYWFLLECLGTKYLFLSAASLMLTILTGYLLVRRSRKGMIFNVLSDLPTLSIWILMISHGDYGIFPLLAMESLYVIQDTFGIFEWRGIKKRQNQKNRTPRRKSG